jgi:hypothetical protein
MKKRQATHWAAYSEVVIDMGFLDKAKATATQAMQQGQAKVEQIQQSRQESELYKTLGEAVYKAQRHGGDQTSVDAALIALDNHFAHVAQSASAPAAGTPGETSGPGTSSGSGTPSGPGTPSASSPSATQEGNFTLDDM